MNTIMEELKEFKSSKLGLYDSATGETVLAEKVINLITKSDFEGQAVVKYAQVERGLIAQICQWYEKGRDLGSVVHYHINEITPQKLAEDSVFIRTANIIGYKPIDLAVVIYHNAPSESQMLEQNAD